MRHQNHPDNMPHSSTKGRFLEKCLKSDKVRQFRRTTWTIKFQSTHPRGVRRTNQVRGKTLCRTAFSIPLSLKFSTLHDIDVFRCCVAEISDNLTGDKRLILLIISVLQQMIVARSYEKTYNLAGVLMSCIYRKFLSINVLHLMSVTKSPSRLSDI